MEKETTDKRIEKTKANILNALIALSKEKELNEISIRELTEAPTFIEILFIFIIQMWILS